MEVVDETQVISFELAQILLHICIGTKLLYSIASKSLAHFKHAEVIPLIVKASTGTIWVPLSILWLSSASDNIDT